MLNETFSVIFKHGACSLTSTCNMFYNGKSFFSTDFFYLDNFDQHGHFDQCDHFGQRDKLDHLGHLYCDQYFARAYRLEVFSVLFSKCLHLLKLSLS